jgi:uncharacterized membrane protein
LTASELSQPDATGRLPGIARPASIAVVIALILSITGAVLTAYLVYENVQGEAGVCVIAHGCSTVQNSSYGRIFGIPMSVPGLGLYVALVAAAIAWLGDFSPRRASVSALAFYGSLFGALFSAYLTYLEAFVIDAWCIYCVVSALLVTCLMLLWGGVLAAILRSNRGRRGLA